MCSENFPVVSCYFCIFALFLVSCGKRSAVSLRPLAQQSSRVCFRALAAAQGVGMGDPCPLQTISSARNSSQALSATLPMSNSACLISFFLVITMCIKLWSRKSSEEIVLTALLVLSVCFYTSNNMHYYSLILLLNLLNYFNKIRATELFWK